MFWRTAGILFRVVASDKAFELRGFGASSRTGQRPCLVRCDSAGGDGRAPLRSGTRVEIPIQAVDAASPLRRAEYSIDAGAWMPLDAADGVIDSKQETFRVRLDALSAWRTHRGCSCVQILRIMWDWPRSWVIADTSRSTRARISSAYKTLDRSRHSCHH